VSVVVFVQALKNIPVEGRRIHVRFADKAQVKAQVFLVMCLYSCITLNHDHTKLTRFLSFLPSTHTRTQPTKSIGECTSVSKHVVVPGLVLKEGESN